jgi:hypothetical protein
MVKLLGGDWGRQEIRVSFTYKGSQTESYNIDWRTHSTLDQGSLYKPPIQQYRILLPEAVFKILVFEDFGPPETFCSGGA